jgi:hypothetical protein
VQNLARLLVAVVVDLSSEHATEQAQSLHHGTPAAK